MSDSKQAALGPQATYEAYLAEGRFMIQRAKSTGEHVFWPRVVTPSGAVDLEWVEARGNRNDLRHNAQSLAQGLVECCPHRS